eukprot:3986504-Pleurochrysis_carterae.AAC.1
MPELQRQRRWQRCAASNVGSAVQSATRAFAVNDSGAVQTATLCRQRCRRCDDSDAAKTTTTTVLCAM